MFKDKGVIIDSALCENIRVFLALWYNDETGQERPLVKPITRRMNKTKGSYREASAYKSWLNIHEVYAMISCLQRVAVYMEEYYEGTLDLKDILAEDEEARGLIATEESMNPTIDKLMNDIQKDRVEAADYRREHQLKGYKKDNDIDEGKIEGEDPNELF